MKKWLSALLALVLCVSAGLAEVELPEPAEPPQDAVTQQHAPEPQPHAPQTAASAPANADEEPPAGDAPAGAPKAEPEGAPETSPTDAPEASPEGAPEASPEEGSDGTAADPEGDSDGSPDGEGEAQGELPPQEPADGEAVEELAVEDATASELGAPGSDEGYVLDGDGVKKPGTLQELLASPGKKTVYVSATSVTISNFKLALLKDVTLLPDLDTFSDKGYEYVVTLKAGGEDVTPEMIDAAVDETVELVIAVEQKPATGPGPGGDGEIQLTVRAPGYAKGVWQNSAEFYLSGIPEGSEDYSYVALIYDSKFIPLSADVYVPDKEGKYTVSFAIWNAQGDVVSSSESYELMLDLTPPELMLEVSETRDYTLILSAIDVPGGDAAECSGVAEFSLDGGESWTALGDGVSVLHTETRKRTFPPNTILVRDAAGNVSGNAEEIVLDKLPDETVDLGGWGGGGGSSTPKPPHASGNGDDSPYASYELTLPDGAVDVLTLGGEEIDLGLQVDGAGPEAFTAELTAWTREGASEDAPPKDTLVIRAEAGAAGVPHAYAWRINGAVLRKLYNSDIDYLALSAGDAMLSLPTVGFTAGTKYAELKMGGVSTSEFEYEIVMRLGEAPSAGDWNRSADCTVEISVTVNGERYDMVDRSATPEMYPYDVYCGPEDLPDYPYGAYPGTEMED